MIINATPLGLNAHDESPYPVERLRGDQHVFDMVYRDEPTALIAGARELGCSSADGRAMFAAQAEVQSQRFLAALESL